ncbi:low-density lipoprotein receptor-related protein 8-like [Solea senegalensis]|uniref:Low-density lipoprotein receptor-related protein 8-like n=1 Tax=Solea senegalensis TaxID=28829 RepID=A0AAV6SA83_SOLSE|nr:low-density lipoprotein receptor-like [Solea senegalensis]KAG7514296.1 low-density lipoprotein receptor-related protein 8-like [Solea senegalensis]
MPYSCTVSPLHERADSFRSRSLMLTFEHTLASSFRDRVVLLWRTQSMGHLGALFLLLISWPHVPGAAGHSLPSCHEQLEFTCRDGSCIQRLKLCDGQTDCEDGSDEQHCSHVWCKKDEFACHSRQCISARLLCNGVNDCGDGSDEESCQKCTAGVFSCGVFDICLPTHKLCDGRADCKDGRDEIQKSCSLTKSHGQTSPTCAASEFQCGDGQCILQAWRCDNSSDCSDGSDENNCGHNDCEVNNGGCSHVCVKEKMGFHCTCPKDMRLVEGSQCEEVNRCLEMDVCDQLCNQINGSLTCDCAEGYGMNPTTIECKAKGDDARLVFTSSKGVQWMSITGTEHRQLAPHLSGPGSVAALASNGTLYWAQQGQGSIYRVSMDGTQHNAMLVLKVNGSVSGLAVDWIHQLLFWTSVESGSVDVATLGSVTQRQLITGLEEPSAVAVDPLQGLLFWAQCGTFPKIERAGLNGEDTQALVTSSVHCPVALSLDVPRQLLYWVDRGKRSISRVNLKGQDRKTVVESNGYLDRPFGLAVFEGFVYWSDEVTLSVCRANKHNGSRLQTLLTNLPSPGGIVIMQPALQPNGPSLCGRPRTVCRHECIVDLQSESPKFTCIFPETGQNTSQEIPAISHTIPASSLSDPTFLGVLSLIIFLSLLLVGMALWWWKEEFRPSRSLTVQSFSLKESQDPLIVQQPPARQSSCFIKVNTA